MADDLQFQAQIYDLVNGYLDLVNSPVPESEFSKDEFVPGDEDRPQFDKPPGTKDASCLGKNRYPIGAYFPVYMGTAPFSSVPRKVNV